VKTPTEIKNRIDALLDKHEVEPTHADFSSKKGRKWLNLSSTD